MPPGPSEPSPSSAELALSRSLEREGRCLRPLASSWARALCKLLSSLTVSGTAKSKSANQAKGSETRHMRTESPEAYPKWPPALTPQTFDKCFRVPGTRSTDEMRNRVSHSLWENQTCQQVNRAVRWNLAHAEGRTTPFGWVRGGHTKVGS